MIHIGSIGDVPPAENAKALVTLAVGEAYIDAWRVACLPSWRLYAARHGYDIVALTAPIDPQGMGNRSPAWQKCLIFEEPPLRRYERVVWLDADIIANPAAPDIADETPEGKVGATLVNDQMSDAEKQILLEQRSGRRLPIEQVPLAWATVQNNVYRANNIDTDLGAMVATGVMALTPSRHAATLRQAYAALECGRAYEQPALSHALLSGNLFHRLTPRWNWGVWDALHLHHGDKGGAPMGIEYLQSVVRSELNNAYFLHFYMTFHLLKAAARYGWSPY